MIKRTVPQKTISKESKLSGVGLHTGKKINLRINPGQPDRRIVFIRTDIKSEPITEKMQS